MKPPTGAGPPARVTTSGSEQALSAELLLVLKIVRMQMWSTFIQCLTLSRLFENVLFEVGNSTTMERYDEMVEC
jgi:hypothetical protein